MTSTRPRFRRLRKQPADKSCRCCGTPLVDRNYSLCTFCRRNAARRKGGYLDALAARDRLRYIAVRFKFLRHRATIPARVMGASPSEVDAAFDMVRDPILDFDFRVPVPDDWTDWRQCEMAAGAAAWRISP